MLVFTGIFYLEFLEILGLEASAKKGMVLVSIGMVLLNVLLEVILLVKGIFEVTCCKKKKDGIKNNPVSEVASRIDASTKVQGEGLWTPSQIESHPLRRPKMQNNIVMDQPEASKIQTSNHSTVNLNPKKLD